MRNENFLNRGFLSPIMLLIFVSAVCLLISTFGCSKQAPPPAPESIKPLDDARGLSVKTKLNSDPMLAPADIKVTVKNYEVTLEGTVSSPELKLRAEKLALKASGINKVINNIQVVEK